MNLGIYIHIPFCKQKCFYCDFASLTTNTIQDNLYQKYIDAVCQEIILYQKLFPDSYVDTIYFGGGTPSILPPNLIIRVLNTIKTSFMINSNVEITMEANPGTIDKKNLMYFYQNGINRLSFGVQAIQDDLLKKIGRIHTITDVENAIYWAKQVGFNNISIDLMYGLPTQTLKMLQEAVDWVVSKKVQHISIYGLQIEENTVFGKLYDKGKLILPSEEILEKMYDYLTEELPLKNYQRYEISNFALNGFESKHNLSYWQDKPFLGIGAGAHGYYQQKRVQNPFNLKLYIKKCSQQQLPFINEEIVDPKAHMEEFCFLGLRMNSGIDKYKFKQTFNISIEDIYADILKKLIKGNLIVNTDSHIYLTKQGMKFGNQVFSEFLLDKLN